MNEAENRDPDKVCNVDGCNAWRQGDFNYCYHHKGLDQGTGAPEGNTNAQTHGLFSERDGYYQALPDDEQEWVFDMTNTLLDRVRNRQGKDPDLFDKEALKNIAIDMHKVAHANGYFREKGIVETSFVQGEDGPVPVGDKVNTWAKELRQHNESVYRRMKKHGLLDDPESQKADAIEKVTLEVSENVTSTWD